MFKKWVINQEKMPLVNCSPMNVSTKRHLDMFLSSNHCIYVFINLFILSQIIKHTKIIIQCMIFTNLCVLIVRLHSWAAAQNQQLWYKHTKWNSSIWLIKLHLKRQVRNRENVYAAVQVFVWITAARNRPCSKMTGIICQDAES